MILIWPSLIIVQMVQVHCISRSHRLKIDFEMKTSKIFLSYTTRPRNFDIRDEASSDGPLLGLTLAYIGKTLKKIFLSETTRPRAFGM